MVVTGVMEAIGAGEVITLLTILLIIRVITLHITEIPHMANDRTIP